MKPKITMINQSNVSIREAYALFVRKSEVKNISAETLKTYQYHFNCFGRRVDIEQPIANLSADMIEDFVIIVWSVVRKLPHLPQNAL